MGLPYRDENIIESGANGLGKWQITRNPAGEILRVEQERAAGVAVGGSFVTWPIPFPDTAYRPQMMSRSSGAFLPYQIAAPTITGVSVRVGWISIFHTNRAANVYCHAIWIKGA